MFTRYRNPDDVGCCSRLVRVEAAGLGYGITSRTHTADDMKVDFLLDSIRRTC